MPIPVVSLAERKVNTNLNGRQATPTGQPNNPIAVKIPLCNKSWDLAITRLAIAGSLTLIATVIYSAATCWTVLARENNLTAAVLPGTDA
jgi:hypothetical protein